MKRNKIISLLAFALALSLPRLALATFCDGANPCQVPGTSGLTGPAAGNITATQISALQVKNSGTANANDSNTQYWFFAYATSLGAPTLTSGSASFDLTDTTGVRVRAGFGLPDLNSPSAPGDLLINGKLLSLKAGTTYDIYVQACKPGAYNDGNGANCSNWVKLPYSSLTTNALPVNPFINPVPADVTVNSLNVKVNGTVNPLDPVGEQATISNLDIVVANQLIGPGSFANPFAIPAGSPPSGYNWLPNTHYQYAGVLDYPYTQATGNTPGSFYTNPVDPGTIGSPFTPAPTHVTASVAFQNAAGATANHGTNGGYAVGTKYTVTLTPVSGSVATPAPQSVNSVTGLATEPLSVFFTGLTDGATYTAKVQAINEGAGWNPSNVVTIGNFVTVAFALQLTISNVTTTAAQANITVANPVGLTHYDIQFSPLAADVNNVWPGGNNATFNKSGLTPNTVYTVQAKLHEGAFSGAFQPVPGIAFTTTPFPPTGGSLSATPFSLTANFTDSSANPNGSTYEMQFCTTGFGTGTCNTTTNNKVAGSAQGVTANSNINPATQYFVQVRTLNVTQPAGANNSNSAYLQIGNITTPPNVQTITIVPNSQTVIATSSQTFSANVTDPAGATIPGATVTWALSGGGTLSGPNPAPSILFTATTPGGPYTLTASRPTYANATATINVLLGGPIVDSLNFAMAPTNKGGTLTVVGHEAGATSITSNFTPSDPSVTFTPVSVTSNNGVPGNTAVSFTKAGTFTLTDDLGSAQSSATVVTVPQVLSSIKVCAAGDMSCASSVTVQTLQIEQFSATCLDQFGNVINPCTVVWTSNGGNINGSGAFSASTLGQSFVVTATSGGKTGSINVTAISFDVSGAYAYPVPYKANTGTGVINFTGLGSQASIRIYTSSGRRVFDVEVNNQNTYPWNIKNSSGESIASGVYSYVIQSPQGKKNGKLIIIQ